MFSTSEGVAIAYISNPNIPYAIPTNSSRPVDILITNVWPKDVEQYSFSPPSLSSYSTTDRPMLHSLIRKLRPRYIFSGGPVFWEREPFLYEERNKQETMYQHVCRFVGLASFGNQNKQRVIQNSFLYDL